MTQNNDATILSQMLNRAIEKWKVANKDVVIPPEVRLSNCWAFFQPQIEKVYKDWVYRVVAIKPAWKWLDDPKKYFLAVSARGTHDDYEIDVFPSNRLIDFIDGWVDDDGHPLRPESL